MSRITKAGMWLSAAFVAAPLGAQQPEVTADEAMARAEKLFETDEAKCLSKPEDGEILVCGQTRSRYALPLPGERGPQDGPRTAIGDLSAATTTDPRPGFCGVRFGENCSGGVNVFRAASVMVKIFKEIVDPDSD